MKARDPASTAPSGAPSPLLKSIQTESQPATISRGETALATQAFNSRAPSMWVAKPLALAMSTIASSVDVVHTVPPPRLVVCSTQTRVCLPW
jgi:hypothetical protein